MKPGIHLFHKLPGPTSFTVVRKCTRAATAGAKGRPPKICHGGTLDPFASGLLLILAEPATRLFDYLHAIPKLYRATIQWGVETDNGDPHGRVSLEGPPNRMNWQELDDLLATFVGWHDQVPHATSAKRIDGERAYLKAHRGEEVVMPASKVYLHEARWLSHDLPNESRIELTARGGYYVRALARDLGRAIGCGAHLTQLHRAAIGPWTDPGPEETAWIHGRDLLPWASSRNLSDAEAADLKKGIPIPTGDVQPADWMLPEGFPDPEAPIRGFHRDKFSFLLKPGNDRLEMLNILPGGL